MTDCIMDLAEGYELTSDGRLYSEVGGPRRELHGWITSQGYRCFSLRIEGRKREITAHRLVADTFIEPLMPSMYVCHNNGDRLDNRVENLRYDTPRGNAADRWLHGTEPHGLSVRNTRLRPDQVESIHARLRNGETRKALAAEFGVTYSCIRGIDEEVTWKWLLKSRGSEVVTAR